MRRNWPLFKWDARFFENEKNGENDGKNIVSISFKVHHLSKENGIFRKKKVFFGKKFTNLFPNGPILGILVPKKRSLEMNWLRKEKGKELNESHDFANQSGLSWVSLGETARSGRHSQPVQRFCS